MVHGQLSKTTTGNVGCKQSFDYQLKELKSQLNINQTEGAFDNKTKTQNEL